MSKPKYPRNPIPRIALPATGGTYVRKNGKLLTAEEAAKEAAPKTIQIKPKQAAKGDEE